MKLWKGATFAFMLCGAALSILLVRNMAAVGQFKPRTKHLYTSSSFSRPSSSSQSTHTTSRPSPSSSADSADSAAALSRQMDARRRSPRSADDMNSLLSDLSAMFQSFTEGELQHVVGSLLDRKRRKSRRPVENQTRRTKRARRPKPSICSVRVLKLTVSELDLGYESDETVKLRYCSGKCTAHRQNYDITMERVMRRKGRKDKVSNGPCCRPTAFEKNFSFLDNKNRYHTIHNVSAKSCGCV